MSPHDLLINEIIENNKKKLEQENRKRNSKFSRKKQKLIIILFAIFLIILILAISIPLSIMSKNNALSAASNDKNGGDKTGTLVRSIFIIF